MLFPLFALVGLVDTVYLVYKRRKSEALVCPLKGDCSFVLNSKYNKFLGIHTDIIGLAYYLCIVLGLLIMLGIGVFSYIIPSGTITISGYVFFGIMLGIIVATFLAFLMTLRMLYIQFIVIKKMCFWCLLSSLCIIGMTCIIVIPSIISAITIILHPGLLMISN